MVLLNRRKYFHKRRPQGAPADLADAVVTLASETVYYTGNPVYPSVSVTYEGAALVVNTDYTLNYTDNTEIGAATVTVTGTGEYTGSVVKTFQIVSAVVPAGWADFDLSKLGDPVANASLTDSTATYGSNENISLLGMQTLPDDSLLFGAVAQGHPYIWGFDDGHAFEISHFKSAPTSRGVAIENYRGAVLANDGKTIYDTDTSGVYRTALGTAYDLSTGGTRTFVSNSGFGEMPIRLQFSNDGSRLFYRSDATNNRALYFVDLATPWDVSSKGQYSSFDLGALQNLPAAIVQAYAFLFSPDGKEFLYTVENNTLYQADRSQYIIKLSLSTAYDLSTATVHSSKRLSGGSNWWQGIAVNNAGTKMLLFKWNGSTARAFYEYNLTA